MFLRRCCWFSSFSIVGLIMWFSLFSVTSEFCLWICSSKSCNKKRENCLYSKNGFYIHNLVYFENLKSITAVVSCVQKTEWGGRKKSHTISYRKWNVNTNKSVKTWINKTKNMGKQKTNRDTWRKIQWLLSVHLILIITKITLLS